MDLQAKSILMKLVFLVSLCLVSTIAQKIEKKPSDQLVIFNPGSKKQIVPFVIDTSPTTSKRYGFHYSSTYTKFISLPNWNPCNCSLKSCNCCVGLKLFSSNDSQNGLCVTLTSKRPEVGINIRVDINGITPVNFDLVAETVTPACLPLAFLALPLSGCLRISQLKFQESGDIEFCSSLDLKFIIKTLYEYNFSCFRIGSNGIKALPFIIATTEKPG